MTERLHVHFSLSCIGEGNGNPLQCSCLENPRGRAAGWAAVYGVAQSRTRLKQLSSSSSRSRGRKDWKFGISRCKLLYIGRINTGSYLFYSTGNCIQYAVIKHAGKEQDKECIYTYVQLGHCCTAETKHNVGSQLYFSTFVKRCLMRQKPLFKLMSPKKLDELEWKSLHQTEGFNFQIFRLKTWRKK